MQFTEHTRLLNDLPASSCTWLWLVCRWMCIWCHLFGWELLSHNYSNSRTCLLCVQSTVEFDGEKRQIVFDVSGATVPTIKWTSYFSSVNWKFPPPTCATTAYYCCFFCLLVSQSPFNDWKVQTTQKVEPKVQFEEEVHLFIPDHCGQMIWGVGCGASQTLKKTKIHKVRTNWGRCEGTVVDLI